MKIALIGGGELGQQLLSLLYQVEVLEEIIIFDDISNKEKLPNSLPFKDYILNDYKDFLFYIGLGYKNLGIKSTIIENLLLLKRELPNLIHSTAYISPMAKIGKAVYIYPKCNIDKHVVIHNGVLINNSATISHDCSIGECSYISPGVVMSGFVNIGSKTFVGTGSVFSNNINVGNNAIVGIGTVVTKNIQDNVSIIGNPAKIVSKKINLR